MLKFNLIRPQVLPHQPMRRQIEKWLRASLLDSYTQTILSISIVDVATSQQLNNEYRNINKPTNVISLEYPSSRQQFNLLSGEIILCDEIIVREALEQAKPILNHYAHMLVHGVLHLQGYDHQEDEEAEQMESLEAQILQRIIPKIAVGSSK